MRREYGTGTVFRTGKSWYVKIRIQGKRVTRALIDPDTGGRPETVSHARRLAARVIAAIQEERPVSLQALDRVRLADLDAEYCRAFPQSLRPGNWRTRERVMRGFCAIFPYVGNISHASLGEWVSQRLRQGRARGGGRVSPATVNREVAFLKRLLSWAAKTQRIERDPSYGFRALPEPHHRERVLTEEERRRLVRALRQERFEPIRLIVLIALCCGMRQGEIFGLRWEDLDERDRCFDLLRTKTGRRRKVPVPDGIWEELQARPRESEWVFPSPKTGGRLNNIRRSWRSLLQEAEIEEFHFHDLRHTAGTRIAEEGDLALVMEILGHTNPRTAKRYVNPGIERRRRVVNEMEREMK